MSLGDLWQLEQPSQSRLNKKTIHPISGTSIASVPLSSPATVFICTATGSGFNVDEMYFTKADGSSRVNVRRKHTHNADTDESGGLVYDIDVANASSRIAIERLTKGGFFHVFIEGAGSVTLARLDNAIVTNSLVTRLRTGTVSNNFTQLVDGGKQLSFSTKIEWHIKMQISHNTSLLWRQGVNMEPVDVAGSPTENRFGMEGCDGDGVNIQLVCANGGAARSKTNSAVNMSGAGMRGYAMYYTPGNNIVWKDSTGNIQTLTTNIPSTGTIASDRMLRYGMKTTNTTEKAMYIAADSIYGRSGDPNWI